MGVDEGVQNNKIFVRPRKQEDLGAMNINEFLSTLDKEIKEKN